MKEDNILNLSDENKKAKILDIECDDENWTIKLAGKIETNDIYGIDIVDERIKIVQEKNIKVCNSYLNNKLLFDDDFFNIVRANQVIENTYNLKKFIEEIYRVLKLNGYAIISTENLASWHNIFGSIMGWQIFSLTNVSPKKLGIGNPIAILKGDVIKLSSWTHKTIFNYRGLKDFFQLIIFIISKLMVPVIIRFQLFLEK